MTARTRFLFTVGLAPILIIGCAGTAPGVAPELAAEIPRGSDVVRIESDASPIELYRSVYATLAERGYDFEESDAEMNTFTSGFKDIGSGTRMQVRAFVREQEGGAVALLRGRWGVTGSVGAGLGAIAGGANFAEAVEESEWKADGSRYSHSFGTLAGIFKAANVGTVSYLTD